MRQLSCPVCHSIPRQPSESLSKISCESCGLTWTYFPEELDSEALYRDEVYAVVDNRQSIFEKIIFSEAEKILQLARKINPSSKSLLDFGSGKGQFLAVSKAQGWKGIGMETEKARADFAQINYQVKVLNQYYDGGKIGSETFDLITLNHVLEHLPAPMSLLQQLLGENLSPTGMVYIEVPRSDSWQAKLAGKHWMHWDIPKHLSHWNAGTLEFQMQKIGFNKIGKRSFSVHLGVLGMLQAILTRLGFRDNLILRLKRKKTFGLLVLVGITLPFAWLLEFISVGFGKSGIMGTYFCAND